MMANQGSTTVPANDDRPGVIRIEFSPGTIIVLLLIIAGLWVLNRLLPVVLVLVAALIIAGTISPAVRWLEERRMRRGLAIAIVFTALMVVAVLIITGAGKDAFCTGADMKEWKILLNITLIIGKYISNNNLKK